MIRAFLVSHNSFQELLEEPILRFWLLASAWSFLGIYIRITSAQTLSNILGRQLCRSKQMVKALAAKDV